MTEKSEDQVKLLHLHKTFNTEFAEPEASEHTTTYIAYSEYLAIKSVLAVAVEALREIKECGSKTVPQTFPWYISRMIGIAKEALGKIGGGK